VRELQNAQKSHLSNSLALRHNHDDINNNTNCFAAIYRKKNHKFKRKQKSQTFKDVQLSEDMQGPLPSSSNFQAFKQGK